MQDRPTADELLEAVQEFLERDVMGLDGRVGYHARVAANVVAIVRRELALGPSLDDAQRARLRAILGSEAGDADAGDGGDVDLREAVAELALAIREGRLDDRRDEVLTHLRATADEKLQIDNPRALLPEQPGQPEED